ncbi:hypothetical protein BD414DRAFT_495801 [Trametes punicea]|nr:hypothetical protein BD414DRAFT_495801 [Trametes punicea]
MSGAVYVGSRMAHGRTDDLGASGSDRRCAEQTGRTHARGSEGTCLPSRTDRSPSACSLSIGVWCLVPVAFSQLTLVGNPKPVTFALVLSGWMVRDPPPLHEENGSAALVPMSASGCPEYAGAGSSHQVSPRRQPSRDPSTIRATASADLSKSTRTSPICYPTFASAVARDVCVPLPLIACHGGTGVRPCHAFATSSALAVLRVHVLILNDY